MADFDYNREDKASLSNFFDIRCEHIHLDWTIDFENNRLGGCCTHCMVVLKDLVDVLELDSSNLNVTSVTIDEIDVKFNISEKLLALGNKLR